MSNGELCCPRCGLGVGSPDARSGDWRCGTHGAVAPLRLHAPVRPPRLAEARASSAVPLWVPWPLPPEWAVTGVALAGDPTRPACAGALALTGAAPLGGIAEVVLVAEEIGTGLGAGYAAVRGTDPGELPAHAPDAGVRVGGHVIPLWLLPSAPDRCCYVGEAMGCWLWIVLWPAEAGVLLLEDLVLHDVLDLPTELLPAGPASPYLRPGH